jgi:hypothetical protein
MFFRARSALAAGVIVFACATSARADTLTVRLSDGSIYSGEIVEKVPNDHVTIKLATGEIRRFEWTSILPSLVPDTTAPAAPPAARAESPVAMVSPEAPESTRHIEVASDAPGVLLVKVQSLPLTNLNFDNRFIPGLRERETPVCYTPCVADVDTSAMYYVRGAYITSSERFAIPTGAATRLSVRTGSSAVGAAGGWSLGVGILSFLFGAVATPVAFVNQGAGSLDGWQTAGLTTLIGGGALILLGAAFLAADSTHVSLEGVDIADQRGRGPASGVTF